MASGTLWYHYRDFDRADDAPASQVNKHKKKEKKAKYKEQSCASFLQIYSSHSPRPWRAYEPQIINFNVAWEEDHNELHVYAQ